MGKKNMNRKWIFAQLLAAVLIFFNIISIAVAAPMIDGATKGGINEPDNNNLLLLPPTNHGEKVPVYLAFSILNLEHVGESEQHFTIVGYLTAEWKDPRLAFTAPNSQDEYQVYSAGQIWMPHFDFANGVVPHSSFDVTLHVYPDGTVKYYERSSADLSNVYNLHAFPFDTQNLKIRIQPSISDEDTTKFLPRTANALSSEAGAYSTLAQWSVLSESSQAIAIKGIHRQTINAVVFDIEIKRDPIFYIWKVFLPLLLMVILSWTVLWIDPSELSSQTQISVTTILTVIAFSFAITTSLPKIPYLTFIDIFFLTCYFFVFITAIEITCMHLLGRKNHMQSAYKVQRFSRIVLPLSFVLIILLMMVYYQI
jgi:hypothetical protein